MGKRAVPSISPWLPLLLLGLLGSLLPAAGQADQPERPQPPASPIQYFDSDPLACKPEVIRASYRARLLPYADQSPAVLARLRRLQDDMTLASMKRCVQKGLLPRQEASQLFRELELTLPDTPIPPANVQPAPPASTPAPTRP
jgi:hypothetical protein